MSPSEAHTEAHERILRVVDMLRLLTMALDGGVDEIGPNEREAICTGTQRTLDEARAARECFSHIPRPRDPL